MNRRLMGNLARVLAAARWADKRLTSTEIENLKDLLFQFPRSVIDPREDALFEMYTKSPVDAAERERLVEDLRETDEPGQSKSSFPKSHEFTIFYLANCIQSRLLSLMLFCVSCPEQPPPDQSPNDHPEGGCASKNSCKNRDDWRVKDKSTQHSRERRCEDHGSDRAPQLL